MNLNRHSKGFSLIEILIAIIILSVSLLALASLMGTTTQNTSFGGSVTEAVTFAQDRLEELRGTQWADIDSGSDTRIGFRQNLVYTRNWDVVQNGNIKTITITVSWTERGNHSVQLVSAITD